MFLLNRIIRERVSDPLSASLEMAISSCPPKKIKLERYPDTNDRGIESDQRSHAFLILGSNPTVLLYAKQENEEIFHPLHLVPPTLVGLALAVSPQTHYPTSYSLINRCFV